MRSTVLSAVHRKVFGWPKFAQPREDEFSPKPPYSPLARLTLGRLVTHGLSTTQSFNFSLPPPPPPHLPKKKKKRKEKGHTQADTHTHTHTVPHTAHVTHSPSATGLPIHVLSNAVICVKAASITAGINMTTLRIYIPLGIWIVLSINYCSAVVILNCLPRPL